MQTHTSKVPTIFTIGHSTCTLTDFVNILQAFNIKEVVDIRTIPKSRHNPQFNEDHLKIMLPKHHIGYIHLAALGGLRHTNANSVNTGWHNKSFRGYADYMQTKEFKDGIEQLCELAQKDNVAIMCAEAVPWRCHRSLVGDALLIRHYDVQDIYNQTTVKPHRLTSFAQVHGTTITYPISDK